MIRVPYVVLVLCAFSVLTTWATGGQGSALPAQPLPGIPGIPRLDLPGAEGSSRPRVIGAVDPPRVEDRPEILSVEKLWDPAPHNGSTDLVRSRGPWSSAFRAGPKPAPAARAVPAPPPLTAGNVYAPENDTLNVLYHSRPL